MGFFARKRIKILPGVNLNLSAKGVGISAGVKGFRISTNSKGDSYLNAGRYGLYYRQKLNKSEKGSHSANSSVNASSENTSFLEDLDYNTLLRIDPSFTAFCELKDDFLASDINDYIKAANTRQNTNDYDFLCVCILFLFIFGLIWHFLLVAIAIPTYIIYKKHFEDKEQEQLLEQKKQDLKAKAKITINKNDTLEFSKFIYLIKEENTFYNADDGYNIGIGCGNIKGILEENVACFNIMGYYLFFIDDGILFRSSKENETRYYFYKYSCLNISMYEALVDMCNTPECCEVVNTTWKYVKKDGTPNLRYKDNPQIDTVKTSVIVLDCDNNFRLPFLFLNNEQARKIFNFIESLKNETEDNNIVE